MKVRCLIRCSVGRAIRSLGRGSLCCSVLAAILATVPAGRALAACTLARIAELPVTMAGLRALVPAKINGADAEFVLDSGAFYSTMTPASAAEFKLHIGPAPYDLHIVGIGGSTEASVATVDVFTLAHVPLRDVEFVVGGGEVGAGAAGLLGQNILRLADTEYDLANGVVRLWRPESCRKWMLAYWAAREPYSVIKIDWTTAGAPHTIASASLNGERIRVMFDTGAAESLLTLHAAERAGFNPNGPDVLSTGLVRGVGSEATRGWVGTFSSFEIGDERIRNARLHIIDSRILGVDMLLGVDFFLSHRIYVATSQQKLYFTYNGGPVFNLAPPPPRTASAAPAPASAAPAAAPATNAAAGAGEPTDAASFSRRGAAFAARGEFPRAIADLTRACELDPTDPRYFYERGEARLGNRQPALAMADFNRALELDPQDVQALVARAALRIARHDDSGAGADLDAAEGIAPKQADVRLRIAGLDVSAHRYAAAVAQFDLWIASHPDDSHKADALNGRCWARGLAGRELRKALRDCNTAVRLRPATAEFLDSRALIEQRLGKLSRSIEDDDAALRLQPKNAWFLYLRGVSELRAGRKVEGRADIASAVDLQPRIVELGRARGVTP